MGYTYIVTVSRHPVLCDNSSALGAYYLSYIKRKITY